MIIELDFRSDVPIARQIADAITLRALGGALDAGSPLPGVRELALQLQVNPNSVERAYHILVDAGVAYPSDSAWVISAELPPSDAAFEPLWRSMRAIIERGLDIGLSRDELSDIFRRAREATDGSD